MKRSTKVWITLVSLAVLLGGGLWAGKIYVSNKITSVITDMADDPSTQKQIQEMADQLANDPDAQDVLKEAENAAAGDKAEGNTTADNNSKTDDSQKPAAGGSKSGTISFKSKNEATQYAMSKFNAKEVVHYMDAFRKKDSLTSEQKKQIKAEILSRFTQEELQALIAASR
ncbi:hypothetical protein [Paenibacillus gansuensis]|uniref:Uncharacterized protein n=1 Tax=Paenibacillus gansuensis TaxID=306542 RepID=A0ABW5PGJ2_9BACL